jgi:hypothetical protein
LTETGSDRYSLIYQFDNASNAVLSNGNGPGDVDYSPVGVPFHVGQSPYWGHGVNANLDAAASDAAFSELGLGLLHEYCWPARAQVPVAVSPERPREVTRKFAIEIRPGDLVRCRPDNNPHTPTVWGYVEEVFANEPSVLMEITTQGNHRYRPTPGHSMFVIGRGWTPAQSLEPGDLLLCEDDSPLRVTSVVRTNAVERVYNFRVRAFHTYFVAPEEGGPAVLSHNISKKEYDKQGFFSYWWGQLTGAPRAAVEGVVEGPKEQGRGIGGLMGSDYTQHYEQKKVQTRQLEHGQMTNADDAGKLRGNAMKPTEGMSDGMKYLAGTAVTTEAGSAGMASGGAGTTGGGMRGTKVPEGPGSGPRKTTTGGTPEIPSGGGRPAANKVPEAPNPLTGQKQTAPAAVPEPAGTPVGSRQPAAVGEPAGGASGGPRGQNGAGGSPETPKKPNSKAPENVSGGGGGSSHQLPAQGPNGVAFGLTRAEREAYVAQRPNRYRKSVVEKVWENAKDANGKVYDPNTLEELQWDRSKTRSRQWDMGHLPGKSYDQLKQRFLNGEISKKQFLDEYNNPANYRPEGQSPNRSHRYQ